MNPDENSISGSYYNAVHCFKNKTSGKNAFGVDVPVWVYGNMPYAQREASKQLENRLNIISKEIDEYKAQLEKMGISIE